PYNIPGGEANPDIAGEISPGGIIAPSADVPSNANPINRINAQNTDIQYPKGKYSADDIESLSFQFMSDLRPDLVEGSSQYGRVPTYNYQMKSDLRPEEEQQLRQQFIDKKINPKVQDNLINRIREDIKTRYNEMKTNYGMDVAREKQIQDKWAVFKAQSDENLQP